MSPTKKTASKKVLKRARIATKEMATAKEKPPGSSAQVSDNEGLKEEEVSAAKETPKRKVVKQKRVRFADEGNDNGDD